MKEVAGRDDAAVSGHHELQANDVASLHSKADKRISIASAEAKVAEKKASMHLCQICCYATAT